MYLRTLPALLITSTLALLALFAAVKAPPAIAAPLAAITPTAEPPTATAIPTTATATAIPATATTVPATATTVPATAIPGTTVPATATAEPPTATTIPGTAVPVTATAEPAIESADPSLAKAVSPASAAVGDTVAYELTVTNKGDAVAREVVVEDPMPSFLLVRSATASRGQVTVEGQLVRVVIGQVQPGDQVRIVIVAEVLAGAPAAEQSNTAVLRSANGSDNLANNTATAVLSVTTAQQTVPSPTATASPETATPPAPEDSAAPQDSAAEAPAAEAQPAPSAAVVPAALPATAAGAATPRAELALLALTLLILGLLTLVRLAGTQPSR